MERETSQIAAPPAIQINLVQHLPHYQLSLDYTTLQQQYHQALDLTETAGITSGLSLVVEG